MANLSDSAKGRAPDLRAASPQGEGGAPQGEADADDAGDRVEAHHVVKGVGTTMLARAGALIEIVSQPLYVWLFGLATYGVYTVLWAAVNLAENIADLGQTSALQRTVPQAESAVQRLSALVAALVFGVGPCLLLAAAASLAAPWLAPHLNVAAGDQDALVLAIRLFAWSLPLWAFVEVSTSALRARRLFGPEIRLRVLWEQAMRLVLALILWGLGWGLLGLVTAHLISLSLTALLAVRLLARHYPLGLLGRCALDRATMADTVRAGLSFLPTNVVAQIFTDGPAIVLNLAVPGAAGAIAAGLYAIARKIASVIQLVRTAFAYVLAPLASAARRIALADVQRLYAFTTRLTTVLVLPIGLVLGGGAPLILDLFGPQARAAASALTVLIAARMGEAVCAAAKPVQQAVSRYRQQFGASLTGLLLAAIIAIILIPLSPLLGAAVAVGCGQIAAAAIPVWQLKRHDGLNAFAWPFFGSAGISAAISLVGAAVAALLAHLPWPWLGWLGFIPLLLATIWAACRFGLAPKDREAMGKVGRILRLG